MSDYIPVTSDYCSGFFSRKVKKKPTELKLVLNEIFIIKNGDKITPMWFELGTESDDTVMICMALSS